MLAGIVTGYMSDKLGRKMSFLITCVPSVFGYFFIALSFYVMVSEKSVIFKEQNTLYFVCLLIGRALSGFGAGAMSLVVPVEL